ncbi:MULTISPECIES: hypothetical protein [Clostridium]|uniref:Uncharacterized protein n=1 Tax=Clostridium coskatii TaxID=1705578 RepID=A0A168PNG5_9CLOT|nr:MULTISPECIES: hypothetical protein [Clostridium]OAA87958.1 hypothetical protein WX73_02653 [Clostridium coskatii]OBR97593.1 hypothetical protein CLCOS_01840 [Clostridium coskatii]QXE18038.1 hypothetical protein B5S50_03820 [Clostridium sp. 001]
MGLYSEMLDEQRIKNMFQGSKNVLVITCPGCACESLSYSDDLPCRSLDQNKDMVHSAIAVHRIRDKWNKILETMNINVNNISVAFPCEMFDTERESIWKELNDIDTIAILACSSAYVAIKGMLPEFKGKFIPMMRTVGTFVFTLIKDETGLNSKVDRKTAKIQRFLS